MKSKIMTAAGLLTVALTFTGCAGNQAKETAAPAGEATTQAEETTAQAEETTAQADASVKETESEAVSETTGNAAESETKNFEQRLEPVRPVDKC